MSCCHDCSQGFDCGSGMAGLMGAIPQQLSEMAGGNPFQFGYNVGVLSGTFGSKIYQPEEIGVLLEEQEGLSYNTHSYAMGGSLNPYIAVEGYAVTSWPSASQFAEAIYQAIAGAGYPIDYSSIQFRFEPYTGSTVPTPPPMVGTPYPNTQTQQQNQLPLPPGQCSWERQKIGDYLSCQLGLDTKTSVGIGAIGALAAVVIVVAVLKR